MGSELCFYDCIRQWFGLVWFYGVQRHFQQYFNYFVAVSFMSGGNGVPGKTTDLLQVIDNLYHIML